MSPESFLYCYSVFSTSCVCVCLMMSNKEYIELHDDTTLKINQNHIKYRSELGGVVKIPLMSKIPKLKLLITETFLRCHFSIFWSCNWCRFQVSKPGVCF